MRVTRVPPRDFAFWAKSLRGQKLLHRCCYLFAIGLHDERPSTSSAWSKLSSFHVTVHRNWFRLHIQEVGFVFTLPSKQIFILWYTFEALHEIKQDLFSVHVLVSDRPLIQSDAINDCRININKNMTIFRRSRTKLTFGLEQFRPYNKEKLNKQ